MTARRNKVTIDDIAQATGVSKTTISYYLNGKYHAMSEQTKAKIELTIQKLGYQTKTINKKNQIKSNYNYNDKVIGIILTDIVDPFCANLCKGMLDASSQYGYDVIVVNTDYTKNKENKAIESLVAKQVAGLIINTAGDNEVYLREVEGQIPVVLADRNMEELIYDTVSSNNYEIMQECLEYIIGKGYNEIALFTPTLIKGTARSMRYQGFKTFSEKYRGKDIKFSTYEVNTFDYGDLLAQFVYFINKDKSTKKVAIGINGNTLMQLLRAVNNLSLKLPYDLGMCGYDDFEWAQLIQNGITTISQPTYDLGYTCVERVIKQIESKKKLKPEFIKLRARLEVRGSL